MYPKQMNEIIDYISTKFPKKISINMAGLDGAVPTPSVGSHPSKQLPHRALVLPFVW